MIDMHYDLLSILYYCHLKNDFSYIEKLKRRFRDNNITGVIANLYFMSKEEMQSEIGEEEINVVSMFQIATDLFKKYFPTIKAIFSIEGCDYIEDEDELEILYHLGLRNILLVWNNKNKYASGTRADGGLTDCGKKFLSKAIELGISIDLSHMNKETFWNTVEFLRDEKNRGRDVKVIVSHSNCYDLCPVLRNLTDEQIGVLKELDVVIGLVSYKPFITTNHSVSVDSLKEKYLEHINRVVDILGVKHVGVSTDDMLFANYLFDEDYEEIFNYNNIKDDLVKLLKNKYQQVEIGDILFKNIENKIFIN